MESLRGRLYRFLRWSEKYTKTDMVYLASGGFWLILEQVVSALLFLLLAIAFGHFASQDTYGNYKYVLSLIGLLGALTLTGLQVAVTRSAGRGYLGALDQGARLTFRYSWIFLLATSVVVLYYAFVTHNPFVALGMIVAAAFTPLLSAFSLFDNFLIGLREFRRSAFYSVASNVIVLVTMCAVLVISRRAIVLLFVYFAAQTVASAFFYARTRKLATDKNEDPEMLKYGFHLSIMSAIGSVADRIDSIIVFSFLGPAALGIYVYAIAIPEQMKGFIRSIATIALPKFAERSIGEIKHTIWRRLLLFMASMIAVIGVYITLAPLLFRYLFPVYLESVPYTIWYAPVIILTVATGVIVSILQAHQRTRTLYVVTNVGSFVLIISSVPLVYYFGIWGALAAQALFRAVNAIVAIAGLLLTKDIS